MHKLNLYLNKFHIALSKDLSIARKKDSRDPHYVKLLEMVVLASFSTLFLTEGNTAHLIFMYILLPIIFAPLHFNTIKIWTLSLILPRKLSFYNIFRNVALCNSPLFLAVLIYGMNKAFLSYLYPEPNIGYLHIFYYYLLAPLIIFMISIIRLCVDLKDFYLRFFRVIGPIAAINASINIYFYMESLTDVTSIGATRMSSVFGAAMGFNPNLDCIIYSIFFLGCVNSLMKICSPYDFYLMLISIAILALAIILEQSRGSTIAMFVGLFILINMSQKKARLLGIVIIITLLLSLVIFSYFYLPQRIWTYFIRGQAYRSEVWLKFFEILKENIYFGIGDRSIRSITLSDGEIQLHSHSIILSSWLRGGILGLSTMIFITIYGLIRSFRYARLFTDPLPLCLLVTITIAGIVDFELKIWQAGWEWAGYWLVIAFNAGADSALRERQA